MGFMAREQDAPTGTRTDIPDITQAQVNALGFIVEEGGANTAAQLSFANFLAFSGAQPVEVNSQAELDAIETNRLIIPIATVQTDFGAWVSGDTLLYNHSTNMWMRLTAQGGGSSITIPNADGSFTLPTALHQIAIDNQGNVYGSNREIISGIPPTGTVRNLGIRAYQGTTAGYLGAFASDEESIRVAVPNVGDTYYNFASHQFRRLTSSTYPFPHETVLPSVVIHVNNLIWLGEFESLEELYESIDTFDGGNGYFCYIEHGSHQGRVIRLTSWTAGVNDTYQYFWTRQGEAESARITALEQRLAPLNIETLPDHTYVDADDLRDQFDTDTIHRVLSQNDRARAELTFTADIYPSDASDTGLVTATLQHGMTALDSDTYTLGTDTRIELATEATDQDILDGIYIRIEVDTSISTTTVDLRDRELSTLTEFIPRTDDIELPDGVKGTNIPVTANDLTDALAALNVFTPTVGATTAIEQPIPTAVTGATAVIEYPDDERLPSQMRPISSDISQASYLRYRVETNDYEIIADTLTLSAAQKTWNTFEVVNPHNASQTFRLRFLYQKNAETPIILSDTGEITVAAESTHTADITGVVGLTNETFVQGDTFSLTFVQVGGLTDTIRVDLRGTADNTFPMTFDGTNAVGNFQLALIDGKVVLRTTTPNPTSKEVLSLSGPIGTLKDYIDTSDVKEFFTVYRNFDSLNDFVDPAGGSFNGTTYIPPTGWLYQDLGSLDVSMMIGVGIVAILNDDRLRYSQVIPVKPFTGTGGGGSTTLDHLPVVARLNGSDISRNADDGSTINIGDTALDARAVTFLGTTGNELSVNVTGTATALSSTSGSLNIRNLEMSGQDQTLNTSSTTPVNFDYDFTFGDTATNFNLEWGTTNVGYNVTNIVYTIVVTSIGVSSGGGDTDTTLYQSNWDNSTTYTRSQIVLEDSRLWISQTNGNTGNRPSTDDGTNWLQLGRSTADAPNLYQDDWNNATTYSRSQIVRDDGRFWISDVDNNTGNDPSGGVTQWLPLTTSFKGTFRNSTTYYIGDTTRDGSRYFFSVSNNNSGNRPLGDDGTHWREVGQDIEALDLLSRVTGGLWIDVTGAGSPTDDRVIAVSDTLQGIITELRNSGGGSFHGHDLVFVNSVSADDKFGQRQQNFITGMHIYDDVVYVNDQDGRINDLNITLPSSSVDVWGSSRNAGHIYLGYGGVIAVYSETGGQWDWAASQNIDNHRIIDIAIDPDNPTVLYVLQKMSNTSIQIETYGISEDVATTTVNAEASATFTLTDLDAAFASEYVGTITNIFDTSTYKGVSALAVKNGVISLAVGGLGNQAGHEVDAILEIMTAGSGATRSFTLTTTGTSAFTEIPTQAFITGLETTSDGFWMGQRYSISEYRYGGLTFREVIGFPDSPTSEQDEYPLLWDNTNDRFELKPIKRITETLASTTLTDQDISFDYSSIMGSTLHRANTVTIDNLTVEGNNQAILYRAATNDFEVIADTVTLDSSITYSIPNIFLINRSGGQASIALHYAVTVNSGTPINLVSTIALNLNDDGGGNYQVWFANNPSDIVMQRGDIFRLHWHPTGATEAEIDIRSNTNTATFTFNYDASTPESTSRSLEVKNDIITLIEPDDTEHPLFDNTEFYGDLLEFIEQQQSRYAFVHRRVANDSTAPEVPTGGSYDASTEVFTDPDNYSSDLTSIPGTGDYTATYLAALRGDDVVHYFLFGVFSAVAGGGGGGSGNPLTNAFTIFRRFDTVSDIVQPTPVTYDGTTLTPPTGWVVGLTNIPSTGGNVIATAFVGTLADDTVVVGQVAYTLEDEEVDVTSRINSLLWDVLPASPYPNILPNLALYDAVESIDGVAGTDLSDVRYFEGTTQTELTSTTAQQILSSDNRGKLDIHQISAHIAPIRSANSDYTGDIEVRIHGWVLQERGNISDNNLQKFASSEYHGVLATVAAGSNTATWRFRADSGKPMVYFENSNDAIVYASNDIDTQRSISIIEGVWRESVTGADSQLRGGDQNTYPVVEFDTTPPNFIYANTANDDYANTTIDLLGYHIVGYAVYSSSNNFAIDVWVDDDFNVQAVPNGHGWSGGFAYGFRNLAVGAIFAGESIQDTPGTAFDNYVGHTYDNLYQHQIYSPNRISSAQSSTDLADMPNASDVADSDNDERALTLDHPNTEYRLLEVLLGRLQDSLERTGDGSSGDPYLTGIEQFLLDGINRLLNGGADSSEFKQRLQRRQAQVWSDGESRHFADIAFWNSEIEIASPDYYVQGSGTPAQLTGSALTGSRELLNFARNAGNYYTVIRESATAHRLVLVNATTLAQFEDTALTTLARGIHISVDDPEHYYLTHFNTSDANTVRVTAHNISETAGDNTDTVVGNTLTITRAELNQLLNAQGYQSLPSAGAVENVVVEADADGAHWAYILLNNVQKNSSAQHTGSFDTVLIRKRTTGIGSAFGGTTIDDDYFHSFGHYRTASGLSVLEDGDVVWISQDNHIIEFDKNLLRSTDLEDMPQSLSQLTDVGKAVAVDDLAAGYTLRTVLTGLLGDTLQTVGAGTESDPYIYDLADRLIEAIDRNSEHNEPSGSHQLRRDFRTSAGDLWSDGSTSREIRSLLFFSNNREFISADGRIETAQFGGLNTSSQSALAFTRNAGNYYIACNDNVIRFYDASNITSSFDDIDLGVTSPIDIDIDETTPTECFVLRKTNDSTLNITNFNVSTTGGTATFSPQIVQTLSIVDINAHLLALGYRSLGELNQGSFGDEDGIVAIAKRGDYMYYLVNSVSHEVDGHIRDDTIIIRQRVTGSGGTITYHEYDSDYIISLGYYQSMHSVLPFGTDLNDPDGYWFGERYHLDRFVRESLPSFLDDSDTPENYTGQTTRPIVVNADEDGLTYGDRPISTVVYYGFGQNSRYSPAQGSADGGDYSADNLRHIVLRWKPSPETHRHGGDTLITLVTSPFPSAVSTNLDNYSDFTLENNEVFSAQVGFFDVYLNLKVHDGTNEEYKVELRRIVAGTDEVVGVDYVYTDTATKDLLLSFTVKELDVTSTHYYYFVVSADLSSTESLDFSHNVVFQRASG